MRLHQITILFSMLLRQRCIALALLLHVLTPHTPALAWGSIGHRLVGQVADKDLTPQAAARVSKIMATNSLGDVANWMDTVRSTPEGKVMRPWHYQSVDACDVDQVQCQGGKCAGPKIEAAVASLRTGQGDQLKALRVLVHLVGDVHQPLHTAENRGDIGGNLVIISNRNCVQYDGTIAKCNLHTYWDNNLVKSAMGKRSEKEYVRDLAEMSVSTGGDAESWIKESNQLAKSTAHNYTGFACQIGPNKIKLSKAYDIAAAPIVSDQLAKAGKRLAALLNDIYK